MSYVSASVRAEGVGFWARGDDGDLYFHLGSTGIFLTREEAQRLQEIIHEYLKGGDYAPKWGEHATAQSAEAANDKEHTERAHEGV